MFGLSLHDIMSMSWRRFRTLVRLLPPVQHESAGLEDMSEYVKPTPKEEQTFDVVNDFDKLAGREPATKVRRLTIDEFMGGAGNGR